MTARSRNIVTIDGPLLHTYATTAAVACKLEPTVGLEIRNPTLTSADALTSRLGHPA